MDEAEAKTVMRPTSRPVITRPSQFLGIEATRGLTSVLALQAFKTLRPSPSSYLIGHLTSKFQGTQTSAGIFVPPTSLGNLVYNNFSTADGEGELTSWLADRIPRRFWRSPIPVLTGPNVQQHWPETNVLPLAPNHHVSIRTSKLFIDFHCSDHFYPNVTTLRSGHCYRKSVCRLSVTIVHATQGAEAFGNISLRFCNLAVLWHPCIILRRSSEGNPYVGGAKRKRGGKIERWWTYRMLYLIEGTRYGLGTVND